MLDKKDKPELAGTLAYNSEWNYFELDGYELHCGRALKSLSLAIGSPDTWLWIQRDGLCSLLIE